MMLVLLQPVPATLASISVLAEHIPLLWLAQSFLASLNLTLLYLLLAVSAFLAVIALLWPKWRVGSQSGLFSSSSAAGLPEIKCLEQILSLQIIFRVRLLSKVKKIKTKRRCVVLSKRLLEKKISVYSMR